jgi:hypothetical protein
MVTITKDGFWRFLGRNNVGVTSYEWVRLNPDTGGIDIFTQPVECFWPHGQEVAL